MATTTNCYLHIYDVNPNNVRFNDGSCAYSSTDYLCQREMAAPTKCGPGSSGSCRVEALNNVVGYSAGKVLRIRNGRGVRRSGDKSSCPTGWKIWSPRNKNDWIKVYNAMGQNINNYPKKPHFTVDVTRPANGCGGCTKYAMKSTTAQQGSWRTTDGSAWWLRDGRYNEPNGDYHANCYLHVYDVNPNNVRFNDGNCNYYSTEYLCQKVQKNPCAKNNGGCNKLRKCSNNKGKAVCGKCPTGYLNSGTKNCKVAPLKCRSGSAGNCKVSTIKTPKYSAGNLVRIHNGRRVRKSTETDSCPNGYKVWSPRNKNDWTIVYNVMKKNINNYPKKPHFIIDVTRPANGCGGCTKYAMRSNTAQQGSWR